MNESINKNGAHVAKLDFDLKGSLHDIEYTCNPIFSDFLPNPKVVSIIFRSRFRLYCNNRSCVIYECVQPPCNFFSACNVTHVCK